MIEVCDKDPLSLSHTLMRLCREILHTSALLLIR